MAYVMLFTVIASTPVPQIEAKTQINAASAYGINDALKILKQLVGMENFNLYQKFEYNVNDRDDVIDVKDALEVLKGLVGMVPPLVRRVPNYCYAPGCGGECLSKGSSSSNSSGASSAPPATTSTPSVSTTAVSSNFSAGTTASTTFVSNATTTRAATSSAVATSSNSQFVGNRHVLYDMQVDPNFGSLSANSVTIPFLRRSGGTATLTTTPRREVAIVGRTGSSQGIRVVVEDIAVVAKPDHEYRIEFSGFFPNAPSGTLRIRRESEPTAQLLGTAPSGDTVGVTRTYEQIIADRTIPNGYSLGDTATTAATSPTSNLTYTDIRIIQICLPACMSCVTRTITFDQNYSGAPANTTALTNSQGVLDSLPQPQRTGYSFVGWYTERVGGTQIQANHVFSLNTTIYARWMDLSNKKIPPELTAHQVVSEMKAGWNLGNTFDARWTDNWSNPAPHAGDYHPTTSLNTLETRWVSTRTTQALIDGVIAAGFDTVRIPVTWHKVADPSNNWNIRKDWIDRIQEVVDMAYNKGMFVIINTHHDEYVLPLQISRSAGYVDRPVTISGTRRYGGRADAQIVIRRFWEQISERFNDGYGYKLIFEVLNEPRDPRAMNNWTGNGQQELYDSVNILSQIAVNAIRASGGNNENRIIMVPTYAANADAQARNAFRVPTDLPQHRIARPSGGNTVGNNGNVGQTPAPASNNDTSRKIAMSVHRYEPTGFTLSSSTANWTESGISNILQSVRNRAETLGIPVVLGEWGVTNNGLVCATAPGNCVQQDNIVGTCTVAAHEPVRVAERARYANAYLRIATGFGMRTVLWDNASSPTLTGSERHGHINRANGTMNYPAIVNAIMAGRNGSSQW